MSFFIFLLFVCVCGYCERERVAVRFLSPGHPVCVCFADTLKDDIMTRCVVTIFAILHMT